MFTVGVAVGCGWQAFVAYVNVGCYYVVGIPLGCVLGFKFDLGAQVNTYYRHVLHVYMHIFQSKIEKSSQINEYMDCRGYGLG